MACASNPPASQFTLAPRSNAAPPCHGGMVWPWSIVAQFPDGSSLSQGNSQQKHLGLLHSNTCSTVPVATVSYEASLSLGTLGGDHPCSLTFKVQSRTLTEEQISCLISTMLYPKTRQPHSIGRWTKRCCTGVAAQMCLSTMGAGGSSKS